MTPGFTIRDAEPRDAETVFGFVMDLARYEKLAHEVVATPAMLAAALFGTPRRAFAFIGEEGGKPVGFALCYYTFSTFEGRAGIYLEDLYVDPAYRRKGLGRAFFAAIARRAVKESCARVEWAVLDWNTPALDFYSGLGANVKKDWLLERLSGDALQRLAA